METTEVTSPDELMRLLKRYLRKSDERRDNGKSNVGENNGRGNDKGARQIPVVSWANAAWVSSPFFAAIFPGFFVAIA